MTDIITITSPPYEDQLNKNVDDPKFEGKGKWNVRNDYGKDPAQLGNLKSASGERERQ